MSQIIELIPALKEIFELINKINDRIKDSTLKLYAEPNEIFDAIDSYIREKSNNITQIKTNKNEIDALKKNIFQTNKEFLKLETKFIDLSLDFEDINKRLENKKNELNSFNDKLIRFEKENKSQNKILEDLESEISDSWKLVEEKIQDVSRLEEKHNQDIIQIRSEGEQDLLKLKEGLDNELIKLDIEYKKQYDELLSKFQEVKDKINSLNLLIKRGFINSELYEFICSLDKKKPLDLNFICQTIKIKSEKAKKVVEKMIEANGPIEFDEKTGTVTLKKEVEFKK
jgi:chromosome segregation ATPase